MDGEISDQYLYIIRIPISVHYAGYLRAQKLHSSHRMGRLKYIQPCSFPVVHPSIIITSAEGINQSSKLHPSPIVSPSISSALYLQPWQCSIHQETTTLRKSHLIISQIGPVPQLLFLVDKTICALAPNTRADAFQLHQDI